MNHEAEERIAQIEGGLAKLGGWAFITGEIDRHIAERIETLIGREDEQTRGQIKALRWVMNLPSALAEERDGLKSALSEMDAGV